MARKRQAGEEPQLRRTPRDGAARDAPAHKSLVRTLWLPPVGLQDLRRDVPKSAALQGVEEAI